MFCCANSIFHATVFHVLRYSRLQASPCVADQAGPSPSMPVSDPIATTSGSPVVVSAVAESTSESAELMDLETMQNL